MKIDRDRNRRMTKSLAHDRERHAGGHEQRRVKVPQIMEPNLGEPGGSDNTIEDPGDVVGPEFVAVLVSKHPAGIFVGDALHLALDIALGLPSGECVDEAVIERHATVLAGSCLDGSLNRLAGNVRQLHPHDELAVSETDVIPPQTAQLTVAKARAHSPGSYETARNFNGFGRAIFAAGFPLI